MYKKNLRKYRNKIDKLDNKIFILIKNRKELIMSLQKYFSLHHYNIENLKSYEVIESLRT